MPMAIFAWPGGKARLASKIIELFPPPESYSVFLDVFGGAANMTLAVPDRPNLLKVFNDVDKEVINFFRVMCDPAARERLINMLKCYSRQEYADAITFEPADPVERAWRFFVLTEQGYSGFGYAEATPGRWGYTVTMKKHAPPRLGKQRRCPSGVRAAAAGRAGGKPGLPGCNQALRWAGDADLY